jgi:uncharacterized C2H2 Zn-finger protein
MQPLLQKGAELVLF